MNEFVSIITPSYNSESFISETVESIQGQTLEDWELLVTDDCSTDSTFDILRDFNRNDQRIKLFKLDSNSGAGVARNNSIKHAQGRYIAFCDSDDMWEPQKLDRHLEFIKQKDLALSYTSYRVISEKGDLKTSVRCLPFVTYKKMLTNNYIGCLTAIYDTQKLGKVFMPEIRKRQDWALWLKILKNCEIASGLDEELSIYRERRHSISSNSLEMLGYTWRIYRDSERISFIKSLWLMHVFIFRYMDKKLTNRGL